MTTTTSRKTVPNIFWIVAGIVGGLGLAVALWRLAQGLGATTNLGDAYPWGFWIVFDIFLIPFSAGAFTMAAIANIMNKNEYHAIARPVILAGFVGYASVVAVLLLDLARWHQFYKILWPPYWNIHSFMLEVTLCITLYTVILLLELSPLIWETFKMSGAQRLIRAMGAGIAATGIVLSCLHQSSLGSLFLLMRENLHELWWSPLLPLFFLISSVFSGLAMIIFVTVLTARAYGYPERIKLLPPLGNALAVLLIIYLVLKVADIVVRGNALLAFQSGAMSLLFWVEIIVGVMVPILLLAAKKTRESGAGLLWGAVCVIVGLALNRGSVGLFAIERPAGAQYFPSLIEWLTALGVLAIAAVVYVLVTQYLPVNEKVAYEPS